MSPYLKSFMKQYREEDRSYPSPEIQLCWRLEALESRLEELVDKDFAYGGAFACSEEDIQYSSPEYFWSVRHIKKAIESVEYDLKYKYGIIPEE